MNIKQILIKYKKNLVIIFLIIFLLITQFGSNAKKTELSIKTIPQDFKYDGCSMFPNGNYLECCTNHDKQYFFGGNWKSRLTADNKLSSCVQSKGGLGHNILGPLMWIGVRIGGAPIFPTSYRWGFGRDL